MFSGRRRTIAALIMAGVEPCTAGQIHVDTRPLDIGPSLVSLSSGDLTLTPSGQGIYSFTFNSPSIVAGKLVIAIENPPAGYGQFRMELDLPFFAEQSLPLRIAAAIANDPLTDTGAANFIRSAGFAPPGPGAIAENVLIHERARRYWVQRSKDLSDGVRANANLDDVGVAYWLLYSTRNLILSNYLNPDEITANAVGFFKTKLADPSEATRLFPEKFVSHKVATNLVESIEARDSFLYYSILLRIEGRLRIGDYAICQKALNFANQVIQLPAYQLSQFNGEYPSTVKAKADAIACVSHDLQSLNSNAPAAPADELQAVDDIIVAASDDLAEGAKALATKSSRTGTPGDTSVGNFTVAVANLQQRFNEFKTLRKQISP